MEVVSEVGSYRDVVTAMTILGVNTALQRMGVSKSTKTDESKEDIGTDSICVRGLTSGRWLAGCFRFC